MILYSLVARGSLVLAEYSESEDDYSQMARKRIYEVRSEDTKLLKENVYLYGITHNDIKFLVLSSVENDSLFAKLRQLAQYFEAIGGEGNIAQQLTKKLGQLFGVAQPIQQDITDMVDQQNLNIPETKSDLRTLKPRKQVQSSNLQKKLCIGVLVLLVIVYVGLEYLIA